MSFAQFFSFYETLSKIFEFLLLYFSRISKYFGFFILNSNFLAFILAFAFIFCEAMEPRIYPFIHEVNSPMNNHLLCFPRNLCFKSGPPISNGALRLFKALSTLLLPQGSKFLNSTENPNDSPPLLQIFVKFSLLIASRHSSSSRSSGSTAPGPSVVTFSRPIEVNPPNLVGEFISGDFG